MATYVENHDACARGEVPPVSRFYPTQLNTDNWVQSMIDLGAKYGVLVAKVTKFIRNKMSSYVY